MADISLASLLVPSKEIEVDFPGFEGLKVKIAFLSKESLVNMRKRCVKPVLRGRSTSEEFDDELFLKLFVSDTVRGWSGLKYKYLEQLIPVDLTGKDLEEAIPYSAENAVTLMKNSPEFDSFVSDITSNLGNFSKSASKQ